MKTKLLIKIFVCPSILMSAFLFVIPSSVYVLDLLQSFTFHALLGYGIMALLFLLWRRVWFASSAIGAFLLLLLFLHPYLASETSREVSIKGITFKVAHFNVLRSNSQYDKTIRKALASGADLLSFQEVDTAWARHLEEGLSASFPYRKVAAEDTSSNGLAVYSRYPLKDVKIFYWSDVPNIAGDVIFAGHAVHFLASHPLSPRSRERYQLRNQHIHHIAEYVKLLDGPVLAIGDYNAVPWNHNIAGMKAKTKLYDSRKGITSTYPAVLRSGGIPIDYIFHSGELQCITFSAIAADGSDHRGVLGTYTLVD